MSVDADRLEFASVRAALAQRVWTPLGEARAKALDPLPEPGQAIARIEAIRETRALLDRSDPPPVWGAKDVELSLGMAEKGLMLEGPALRAIAETMLTGAALRGHLLGHERDAPSLFGLAASLSDTSRTAHGVLRCFEPDGQLRDDASPELGALRQRVRSLQESVRDEMTELLASPAMDRFLQERYFTIRGDRYVLPIKTSFKNEVTGIVHDASASGQTVFIEPQSIVDLGNRLKIAQSEEQEEVHRILSELTRRVAREAEAARKIVDVVGQVDFLSAAARLANDLACVPLVPEQVPGFALVNARHPLLLLERLEAERPRAKDDAPTPFEATGRRETRDVVGNDLALGDGQRILVLTGPNTGGKTVAMKTVGLVALFVRAGLHAPCREGSRIGWFDPIEVSIGDMQSIASHLSTFAAHVKELVHVLENAGPRSLVLIDEIAADTDPGQGQAIAQAVLEALAERGAHVVVTTHFERLKAIPFQDRRFRNAGVGFDASRLAPTYRVTLDVPQGSSGFDIAQSLGVPRTIVDRARELVGPGAQALEDLMKELERRSAGLEAAEKEAREAARRANQEREALERKRAEVAEELDALRAREREALFDEIESARGEVKKLVAALQGVQASEAAKEVMRRANETAAALAELQAKEAEKERSRAKAEAAEARTLSSVSTGDWVHVARLGKDGDVLAVDGKEATVVVGNIRMRVPTSTLLAARGPRPKKSARPEPGKLKRELEEGRSRRQTADDSPRLELDVRGFTSEEALERLDGFLDHHYGSTSTQVSVIHGHGTGALREAIREHLRRSGYVKSIRPGEASEGGDGVTVVSLS